MTVLRRNIRWNLLGIRYIYSYGLRGFKVGRKFNGDKIRGENIIRTELTAGFMEYDNNNNLRRVIIFQKSIWFFFLP